MVRSASSRSFCPFQRRTLMHGDVVGLVARDFILWLILACVVRVPFVLNIFRVHLDDRPGDVSSLRVPGHVIADLECSLHEGSPRIALSNSTSRRPSRSRRTMVTVTSWDRGPVAAADPASGPDKQIPSVDLHQVGTHGLFGWPAEHSTGGHVKLAAVAAARHRRVVQRALPKGAPHVGTGVIEGVQMSVYTRHVHLGSRDVENTHLPGDDILRMTKSYYPDSDSTC